MSLVAAVDARKAEVYAPAIASTSDHTGVDHVLRTTRSVRRRLDLERPVPDRVLLDAIEAAEQAPTGGNQSSRRWLVIRDPATRAAMADLYRSAGGTWMIDQRDALAGTGHHNEKVMASAAHLVEHLHEVPVLVLVSIWGEHDGSGRPGLFDSVIQAAWSFCLTLRSRGLGTAWTTLHLNEADRVAELLAIPAGVTQVVLFPVAYTIGTDFKEAPREPVDRIVYHDRWGNTATDPAEGEITFAGEHGVTVEVDVDARPDVIWPFISDPDLPTRFRDDRERTSHVVVHEPPTRFGWNVGDAQDPGSRWRLECLPLAGATRLRFSMVFGPGASSLTSVIGEHPEDEARIIRNRQEERRAAMTRTVEEIKALVETPTDDA